jgi:hypothetical protein
MEKEKEKQLLADLLTVASILGGCYTCEWRDVYINDSRPGHCYMFAYAPEHNTCKQHKPVELTAERLRQIGKERGYFND